MQKYCRRHHSNGDNDVENNLLFPFQQSLHNFEMSFVRSNLETCIRGKLETLFPWKTGEVRPKIGLIVIKEADYLHNYIVIMVKADS